MRRLSRLRLSTAALAAATLLLGCAEDATDEAADELTATPDPHADATDEAAEPPAPEPPEEQPVEGPPDEVEIFEDPGELAEALVAAEEALADPDTPEEHRDGWAWVHQQAYRDLAANRGWQDEVRAEVPEELLEAFELTLRAQNELDELTSPQPELPSDWRIVPPPPLDELRGYYDEAAAETDVPWSVLAAIHLSETRFGRIQGDSYAGAQGPMQFMPPTWEAFGEGGDVRDPRDAIHGAARYLAASGAPDDLRAAVFAYNRSDRYVEAVLSHAEAMERYDHYLDVYHRWRVYYRTVDGDHVLEEGYGS